MSTVISTSAGLFSPSALMRSARPCSEKMAFTLMPVAFENASSVAEYRPGSRFV
jgi:hypothetical protein